MSTPVPPITPCETYDFIISGGGTTGCVLASRLASLLPTSTFLLVEAGPHNLSLLPDQVSMVGGLFKAMNGPLDWNMQTVPQKELNGRVIKCNRGKFLGGSSGFNGTLCIRGMKEDWDDWGLEGWGGEGMWGYMKSCERFHGKEWFKEAKEEHGMDGLLNVEPHDVAPISELVLESMQDLGLPVVADLFTTGETSTGCGHVLRTVHGGMRSTSADFLKAENHGRGVDVVVDTTVDRVVVEAGQAVGVVLVDKEGEKRTVRARKEVVVSSGTYCSPTILMRSGIGPKDHLEEMGIECVVDLPGVGSNLIDHLVTFIGYEIEKPGLTNDAFVYHGNAGVESYMAYQDKKTGVFSTFPFGVFAYTRLDERLEKSPEWKSAVRQGDKDPMGQSKEQPHVEFFNTELYSGVPSYANYPFDGRHGFEIGTILFAPRSTGTVKLKSTDPRENPIIDNNFLADPLDLLVQTEGVMLSDEIITKGAGTKDIIKGYWLQNLPNKPPTGRDDWIEVVRQNTATGYHAAGTCKMGKTEDPMAVLDEKLRVRDIQKLRVADVSIMPRLNNGHSQLPAYAIGQKAADIIYQEHRAQ